MKAPKILLVLLACLRSIQIASAANPVADVHWYTVVVGEGNGTEKITGCSSLNADQVKSLVSEPDPKPLRLDHIRAFHILADKSGWQEDKGVSSLFIMPRRIAYFCELVTEPKLMDQ